jgi:beta-lactamase regulating signal transducer with metallopeptidase domain
MKSMSGSELGAVAALNLVLIVLLMTLLAWISAGLLRSLSARHAVLLAGILGCLAAPLLTLFASMAETGRLDPTWLGALDPRPVHRAMPSGHDPLPTFEPAADGSNPWTEDSAAVNGELMIQIHSDRSLEKSTSGARRLNSARTKTTTSEPWSNADPTSSRVPDDRRPTFTPDLAPPAPIAPAADLAEGFLFGKFSWDLLIAVWVIGILVAALRQAQASIWLRALLAQAKPCHSSEMNTVFHALACEMGHSRPPRLREVSGLPAPVVAGTFNPVVIVPTDLAEHWDVATLRPVLAHELAHVQRRDPLWAAMANAVSMLYWWNPLVHRLSSGISVIREMICDDIATRFARCPREYAATLVDLAERAVAPSHRSPKLGVGLSSVGQFERRVQRLCHDREAPSSPVVSRSFCSVLTIASGLTAALASAAQFQYPQTDPTDFPPSEPRALDGPSRDAWDPVFIGNPLLPRQQCSGRVLGVDGRPFAGCQVRVLGIPLLGEGPAIRTDEQGRFEFVLGVHESVLGNTVLLFIDDTQHFAWVHPIATATRTPSTEELEIQLAPTQEQQVTVVDGDKEPISAAWVALLLEEARVPLVGQTNENGQVVFRLPGAVKIASAVAWKEDAGLDYRNYLTWRSRLSLNHESPNFPTERGETLSLTGTKKLSVRFVDEQDRPIQGVETYPISVERPESNDSFNLSALYDDVMQKSDGQGWVHYRWFPKWQHDWIQLQEGHPLFVRLEQFRDHLPISETGEVVVKLQRSVSISGRVVDQLGQPIADVRLGLTGRAPRQGQIETRTDAAGKFRFQVVPNQVCLVAVIDKTWGAEAKHLQVQSADHPIENLEFELRPTTRVFGTLVNEDSNKAVFSQQGRLVYLGPHREDFAPGVMPKNQIQYRQGLYLAAPTFPDGSFEFQLGPGDYFYSLSHDDHRLKFTVAGEESLTITPTTKTGAWTRLSAQAVSKIDGNPVRGARVLAILDRSHSDRWETTTDDEGRFSLPIREEPGQIQVISPQRDLVVIGGFGPDNLPETFELEPPRIVRGRLVDSLGSPIPNQSIELTEGGPHFIGRGRFSVTTTTVNDGRFEFRGLAPDWQYQFLRPSAGFEYRFLRSSVDASEQVQSFSVGPGQTMELGDIARIKTR